MTSFDNTLCSYRGYLVSCLLVVISVGLICLNVMDTYVADITWKQRDTFNKPPSINPRFIPELLDVHGRRQEYRYQSPFNNSRIGRPLHVNNRLLRSIGFPLTNLIDQLDNTTVRQFAFATAVNSVYYTRLLQTLETIQRFYPNYTLFVYDVGLNLNQRQELSKGCDVIVRDFTKISRLLPVHSKLLKNYPYKALIIHDVMRTNHGVFWVNSINGDSILFNSNNLETSFQQVLESTHAALMFAGNTGHSIYAVTASQTYTYLPTSMVKMKELEMLSGMYMLFYRTRTVYIDILQWMVLCTLDANCIGKPSSDISKLRCKLKNNRYTTYANCHSYDQSMINIILANALGFRFNNNISQDNIASFTRKQLKDENVLKTC